MMEAWCVCGTEASTCVGRTTDFENVTLPLRRMDLYPRQRQMVELPDNRINKWCRDLCKKRHPTSRILVRFYASNGPFNCRIFYATSLRALQALFLRLCSTSY